MRPLLLRRDLFQWFSAAISSNGFPHFISGAIMVDLNEINVCGSY